MKRLKRTPLFLLTLLLCLSMVSCGLFSPSGNTGDPDNTQGGFWDNLLCSVTFVPNNGTDPVTATVTGGARITRPQNPKKEGHLFDDWYVDEALTTPYDFSKEVTRDLTLYAGYYTDYAALTNTITADIVPATVTILATHTRSAGFMQTASTTSTGSGVLFHKDGSRYYLLTNYHVTSLRDGYTSVSYTIEDYCGEAIDATYVYGAAAYDLALLSFESDTEYPVLPLASQNPDLNTPVVCIGQPKGQDNAITYGTLLHTKEVEVDGSGVAFPVFYHNAPLATGSSGGALLNLDFEIVGINFAVATDKEDGTFLYGLTIPLEKVQEFLALH